jgi:cytochrome b561
MMLKSDKQHWGSLAQFFHWTIVLLILVQGTLGLVMVDLPKKPSIIPLFSLHKSIGMTILFLAVLRLGWRAFDRRPADPAGMPKWQVFGAHAGHMLLYVLLFLVPLSGWWFDSVSGLRPLYWFNLFEIPHMATPDPALKQLARDRHELLFWILVVVAAGHAAMAFVHQFINRDGTLSRMLPTWRRRTPAPAAVTVASPKESSHVEFIHAEPNPPPVAALPASAPNPARPVDPADRGPGT